MKGYEVLLTNTLRKNEKQMVTYLIRHAETEKNAGTSGEKISQKGLQQLQALARKSLPIRAVYASDLPRARHTATAIARRSIHYYPCLREISSTLIGGSWESNEPVSEQVQRVRQAFKLIQQDNIAVVCHANMIRVLLASFAKLPPEKMCAFEICNASITTIDPQKKRILTVNDTSHLNMPHNKQYARSQHLKDSRA